LTPDEADALAWEKMDGLLPAVVQHPGTRQVLMLGYMDRAALDATLAGGKVTFFSRSKARLWTKGETSGHHLSLRAVRADCDGDALLVEAEPIGPTCHLGTPSCFGQEGAGVGFLAELAEIVTDRAGAPAAESYTARLLQDGPARIAQKVGEEGVEVALAAVVGGRDDLVSETADLVYHLTVLMQARGFDWADVSAELQRRHRAT
jgi:phosphoribosyl-ATP pyrophosphohydrolase/phosphoribosyl-AMP cyclohydrolase